MLQTKGSILKQSARSAMEFASDNSSYDNRDGVRDRRCEELDSNAVLLDEI